MSDQSLLVRQDPAPIRSQVVATLRKAIIEQRFKPGDRLREREVCDLLGVSRTSVREALRQLESEHLVEVVANRGPIVARLSPDAAREIYEIRSALEGLAGRLCALNATDEEIEQLAELLTPLEQAADRDDVPHLIELKDEFYRALFTASRNAMLLEMIGALNVRISALRAATLSRSGRPKEMLRELRQIIAALKERDPEAASAACSAHVMAASRIAAEQHAASADDGSTADGSRA